jgi:hypothetical protein
MIKITGKYVNSRHDFAMAAKFFLVSENGQYNKSIKHDSVRDNLQSSKWNIM